MLIEKVDIPEKPDTGLKKISMSKLDNIVLIAGKNGSGKSRLLTQLQLSLREKPSETTVRRAEKEITQRINNIKNQTRELEKIEKEKETIEPNSKRLNELKRMELELKQHIQENNKGKEACNQILNWREITTSKLSDSYRYVNFVPKHLNLRDSSTLSPSQLKSIAMKTDVIGIDNSHDSCFSKIQYIQNQWFNATHHLSSIEESQKNEAIENYGKLCSYISTFLNTKLDRDLDGTATLFNLPLGASQLSDGQKVLLQLCIAIYSQESKLNELIIFMDEPENHLHPKVILEVIDRVLSAVKDGQLWIATHSINLLAHYDPKYIWYMEDGEIKYSGNIPERVLEGLIGSEDEIGRLSNFLALPAQMATTKFAIESLLAPQVVITGSDDPQTNQIIDTIKSLRSADRKLKVLDLGAGKGRLLSALQEVSKEQEISIPDWLDYYAFDTSDDDREICIKTIEVSYPINPTRYFNDTKSLLESIPNNTFDIVIMCNVFHEIDPKYWLGLFSENEIIRSSLSDDGILLIVEDQLIPVGEKAYQNGFLVFDKVQFKKLFNIEDYVMNDARGDGRLRAHFITASHLSNVDSTSRKLAIENLRDTANREIRRLRSETPNFKNGKLHGFWTQQLANAHLALTEL